MTSRRVLATSAAVAIASALTYRWLFLYIQGVADSGATSAPTWWVIVWTILSFPGRYLHYLPPFNHPFGFGEHEDLILAGIALANGLVWGGAAWVAQTYKLVRRS